MLLEKYTKQLQDFLARSIRGARLRGYAIVVTAAPNSLVGVLSFLKRSTFTQFRTLIDITCYDRPGKASRFVLVYGLLSTHFGTRCFLCIAVPESGYVPSVSSLFPVANWYEREI
jgi:NADH-quinone oxidoreductase subunit C